MGVVANHVLAHFGSPDGCILFNPCFGSVLVTHRMVTHSNDTTICLQVPHLQGTTCDLPPVSSFAAVVASEGLYVVSEDSRAVRGRRV